VLFDWHAPLQDAVETSNIDLVIKEHSNKATREFREVGRIVEKRRKSLAGS
jgi:hypothetical protein